VTDDTKHGLIADKRHGAAFTNKVYTQRKRCSDTCSEGHSLGNIKGYILLLLMNKRTKKRKGR